MRLVLIGSLLVVVVGCAPVGLVGSPAPTDKAPYTLAPPTPTISPIATVAPTGHGRPYTAEMIAVELLDVAYNFPPELQTDFIAAALADRIWTYDGRPYREISISGSCNEGVASHCEVTVVGLPAFAMTRDWSDDSWFNVDLSSRVVTGGTTGGQGFPPELVPEIEALARSLDTEGRLDGIQLRHVGWLPPPPDDGYALDFGNDGLEGTPRISVTLDRRNRQIISMQDWVCCG